MSRVLVIGCGGVASVAIQKCCQVDEVFTEMCIASRTKEKCDALVEKLKGKTKTVLTTAKVDADDVDQLIELINSYKPELVMNIALPYQDLTIMDACLACGVNYMDTANYEPEDTDDPEWRAIYEKRCKEEGFSAYFQNIAIQLIPALNFNSDASGSAKTQRPSVCVPVWPSIVTSAPAGSTVKVTV